MAGTAPVIRVKANEARHRLRWLLSEVEHGGFVEIFRYQDPAAVMVPFPWYQKAVQALGEPASDS
jgi:antitoxin (DNA-binding transcriptional repressor) of toxin-antitoxin stability system